MKTTVWLAAAIAAALTACDKPADTPAEQPSATPESTATADACPDDGPRLELTGLCAGRAVNYLNMAGGTTGDLPEGCEWVVAETEMPMEEVLLYRAARCGDVTSKLELAGGAQVGELYLVSSAFGNPVPETPLIRIISSDPAEPTANIRFFVRNTMEDVDAAALCDVRPAEMDVWPDDAYVVDVSEDVAATLPQDEPRAACGPYGYNGDEAAYWRVAHGFSWYYSLGQDAWIDIDPGSVTLVRKAEDGSWEQVPANWE